jgi:tRNA A37 threonylcarbamoyladenosine dehydratase
VDFERRFGGVRRLYGDAGFEKLQAAHLVVVGIGGVGSWAAEALARNAVGTITLVDLDNISESNFNRQLHAIDGNIGKPKVSAMRERILSINPDCVVHEIEEFVTPQNISNILNFKMDGIVDCIDDAEAKASMTAYCRSTQTPLVMVGGAGGRLDASKIKTADMAKVTNDRLLAKVRNLLRRDYGFPKGEKVKFNVTCVYSDEPTIKPDAVCKTDAITGLNCAGYGSSVCVTAPFGFTAAGVLLKLFVLMTHHNE